MSRERNSFRFRATVDWFVVHLDKGLGLTENQRQRFAELLMSEAQPPRKFGPGDYWYLLLQSGHGLPEAKVKPIFDTPLVAITFPTTVRAQPGGWSSGSSLMGYVGDDEKQDQLEHEAAGCRAMIND